MRCVVLWCGVLRVVRHRSTFCVVFFRMSAACRNLRHAAKTTQNVERCRTATYRIRCEQTLTRAPFYNSLKHLLLTVTSRTFGRVPMSSANIQRSNTTSDTRFRAVCRRQGDSYKTRMWTTRKRPKTTRLLRRPILVVAPRTTVDSSWPSSPGSKITLLTWSARSPWRIDHVTALRMRLASSV